MRDETAKHFKTNYMKYKEIKLDNNKSVLVDENAEIKEGDYFFFKTEYKNHQGIYTNVYSNTVPNDSYCASGFGYCLKIMCYKIIVTINHSISLDVPMVVVEDEIEKLALIEYPENWVEDNGCNYIHQIYDDNKSARLIWIKGYKAKQQNGGYSKEDLRQAIWQAVHAGRLTCTPRYLGENGIKEITKDITTSLSKEYIELVTEEYTDWIKTNGGQTVTPVLYLKIVTKRVNGQLMAYVNEKI